MTAIQSWTAGGRVENLADPSSLIIDFSWIAEVLARIPRFNNKHGGDPLSVAQHCVQGADALFAETRSTALAGAFLVHDAHEAWIGDRTPPVDNAIELELSFLLGNRYAASLMHTAVRNIKVRFDAAICATLPDEIWNALYSDPVKEMDKRMGEIEAYALFGPYCFEQVGKSGLPTPKLQSEITPVWSAQISANEWLDRLQRYCGVSEF